MTESAYQTWLYKNREWIGAYCSYTRKISIRKVVPLILVLLALLFGFEGFKDGDLTEGIINGLTRGLVISGIYLVITFPSLTPAWYIWKLKKSVQKLSMYETERELLGKEMLETLDSGAGVISYRLMDPTKPDTIPARVVLTSHYILQEGYNPWAILVRLNDIAKIQTGSEMKAAARGRKIKTLQFFPLYTIGFYRKDRFERGLDEKDAPDYVMGFFQEEIRDEIVRMMWNGGLRVNGISIDTDGE